MTAITTQKQEVRSDIAKLIGEYLSVKPDGAVVLAIAACGRLAAKMSLVDLQDWRAALLHDKHTWRQDGLARPSSCASTSC